jgi:hypothetical protein
MYSSVLIALLLAVYKRLIKYKEVNMVDVFPRTIGFSIMVVGLIIVYVSKCERATRAAVVITNGDFFDKMRYLELFL